ncbi:hypothetical protein [Amycolatopsis minnesotensis]|uniref:Uncharacterized protein n=1 Tax=Amycolatopsis minnesotensis TaxID=337894 RepID=A0ABP5BPS1_9PSEU
MTVPEVSEVDDPARTAVRRAAREVREVAFRALVATGVSGGEAAAAAEAVLWAEGADGSGIAALLAELGRPRLPSFLDRDGEPVVVSGDGPLLLGPHVVDLAVALGRPVSAPRLALTAVLESFARTAAVHSGVALRLTSEDRCSLVTSGGRVFRVDGRAAGLLAVRLPADPEIPAGSTEIGCPALPDGLRVAAGPWAAAYAASRRFLVPEG